MQKRILIIFLTLVSAFNSVFATPVSQSIRVNPLIATDGQFNIRGVKLSNPFQSDVIFETYIHSVDGAAPWPNPVDVYFCGILPDGTVFTWIRNPDSTSTYASIAPGFQPTAKNLIIGDGITSYSMLPRQFSAHRFGPGDQAGMYIMFTLVVSAGSDPLNPDNWLASNGLMFPVMP